jgi:viroplasmin and RNaseH domain-containing protein
MAYTNSIGSSTSSTKRKRDSETLFYAVKKGKVPGIYQSWPEAQEASGNFEKYFCT